LPGYNVSGWFGLLAPRGTPQLVIQQLNAMMLRIMAMPDVRSTLARGGADLADPSLPAMEEAIRNSVALFENAVRTAGVKAD
jgi:tripartite-type tricarboxylate transporter receptor subunit TctC